MATLDIRDMYGEIDTIVFASCQVDEVESATLLGTRSDRTVITIEDGVDVLYIRKYDIPNLIKALQKAQEIWKE